MADYIDRQTVLQCIKESRENIDWGQSEDGDAFLHYSAALYRTIASKECLSSEDVEPVVHCRDCIFGHKYFEVINGITDSWVECISPDGLHRNVPCGGYCHVGIKRREENRGEQDD